MISLVCHAWDVFIVTAVGRGASCGKEDGLLYLCSHICPCIFFAPQIGDHKFSAHRIVLAASIPYFHAMFTNDMMECKQDEIVMQGMDPRY